MPVFLQKCISPWPGSRTASGYTPPCDKRYARPIAKEPDSLGPLLLLSGTSMVRRERGRDRIRDRRLPSMASTPSMAWTCKSDAPADGRPFTCLHPFFLSFIQDPMTCTLANQYPNGKNARKLHPCKTQCPGPYSTSANRHAKLYKASSSSLNKSCNAMRPPLGERILGVTIRTVVLKEFLNGWHLCHAARSAERHPGCITSTQGSALQGCDNISTILPEPASSVAD